MITTKAIPALCRCGALTLTGVAEGLRATVDPAPISQAGRIAAALTGRWIFTLTTEGLIHLDTDRIKSAQLTRLILAEHKCGQPLPARPPTPIPAEKFETEEIPF